MPFSLKEQLPWTQQPLIVNAPMGGIAYASLALSVHSAGGMGFIGAELNLEEADHELGIVAASLPALDNGLLPIGIGFLLFGMSVERTAAVVKARKPAVVWLSMPKSTDDFAIWAVAIRNACPQSRIWVQVGSVAAALQVARDCKPDAICMQGADAGGHGYEQGAGVISLLPEVSDALAAEKLEIPLLAAGGIVDGRGVAAALVLGAQGSVLGTRFLAASEADIHQGYREALLKARDGGQTTIRSKLFDNLRGKSIWPEYINGRSLVSQSYTDHLAGVHIDEIRRLHQDAVAGVDKGYDVEGQGRAVMWAGTGVGLVAKEESAAAIVAELRREAVLALSRTSARL